MLQVQTGRALHFPGIGQRNGSDQHRQQQDKGEHKIMRAAARHATRAKGQKSSRQYTRHGLLIAILYFREK